MPFVSKKGRRERMQTGESFSYRPEPEFSEVFNASLGLVIDEELSISGGFDREGLQARNAKIDQLIRSGSEDAAPFTNPRGAFNYGKFAETRQIDGIQTNSQLRERRNLVLADRRAYAKDVIERGSGMAQFLGAATGYMLDPINIATMGLSGAVVGAKSLSVMGRALMTARNTAAIGAVSELAIQPLVYIHKQDIESPYAARDAIAAIATTALGAGLLGGAAGGISGYLKSVRKSVEGSTDVTPEVESGLESIARMESSIAADRAQRITPDIVLNDYDRFVAGEFKSFTETAASSAKTLEKEIKRLTGDGKSVKKMIQNLGGINRDIARAEGFDPEAFKFGGSKPLFRKNGGKSFDDIAEALNEINYAGAKTITANDAVDIIDDIVRGNNLLIDASKKADIEYLQNQLDVLSEVDVGEEFFESFFKGIRSDDIDSDARFLQNIEDRRIESNQLNTVVEDYFEPEGPKAPSAKVTPREREILQDSDGLENHNRDMAAYANLSDVQKAEVSEAMSKFDDELEGLESVLVCSIA